MEIKILNEAGLEEALIGMRFSFQPECVLDDIDKTLKHLNWLEREPEDPMEYRSETFKSYYGTALKLCKRDGGHNKFLQCIQIWMIVRAPLYFWKQFDQYKVATTTLSKSTMHTLTKKYLESSDFEGGLTKEHLRDLNSGIVIGDFDMVNKLLPHSFLQTRMVNVNYKTLRNMLKQREGHKLQEWDDFIAEMYNQLNTPELLGLSA